MPTMANNSKNTLFCSVPLLPLQYHISIFYAIFASFILVIITLTLQNTTQINEGHKFVTFIDF